MAGSAGPVRFSGRRATTPPQGGRTGALRGAGVRCAFLSQHLEVTVGALDDHQCHAHLALAAQLPQAGPVSSSARAPCVAGRAGLARSRRHLLHPCQQAEHSRLDIGLGSGEGAVRLVV